VRQHPWYERLFYRYAGNCYRTECLEVTRWRCLYCRTYWILRVAAPLFYRDVRRRLYGKAAGGAQ
jgi:hypothetical protein